MPASLHSSRVSRRKKTKFGGPQRHPESLRPQVVFSVPQFR
jgi:hypothetical protein